MWVATVLSSDHLHQACSVSGVAVKMRMAGPEMRAPKLYVQVFKYFTAGVKGCARRSFSRLGREVPLLPPGNGRAELCLTYLSLLGAVRWPYCADAVFIPRDTEQCLQAVFGEIAKLLECSRRCMLIPFLAVDMTINQSQAGFGGVLPWLPVFQI